MDPSPVNLSILRRQPLDGDSDSESDNAEEEEESFDDSAEMDAALFDPGSPPYEHESDEHESDGAEWDGAESDGAEWDEAEWPDLRLDDSEALDSDDIAPPTRKRAKRNRDDSSDDADLPRKLRKPRHGGIDRARSVSFTADELAQLRLELRDAIEEALAEHTVGPVSTLLDVSKVLVDFVDAHREDQRPYTAQTGHTLSNLAQSVVGHSESYPVLRKAIGDLKRLGAADSAIIRMLIATDVRAFDAAFNDAILGTRLDPEQRASYRAKMWRMVQVWLLEAARRRSAGVMNAVNARIALDSPTTTAQDVFGTQNVMSHEGASGKSQQNSKGKATRYSKEIQVVGRLLAYHGGDILLLLLRDAMRRFLADSAQLDEYAESKAQWDEAAGARSRKNPTTLPLKLHETRGLAKILLSTPQRDLTRAFVDFVSQHYSGEKVDQESRPEHDAGTPSRAITWFDMWLINKAASAGHQRALDALDSSLDAPTSGEEDERSSTDGSTSDGSVEPDDDEGSDMEYDLDLDTNEPVTIMTRGLRPPGPGHEVTSGRYVANLRTARTILGGQEMLNDLRMHSDQHSQHVDLWMDSYEAALSIVSHLQVCFESPDEFAEWVRGVLLATTIPQLEKALARGDERIGAYLIRRDQAAAQVDATVTNSPAEVRKRIRGRILRGESTEPLTKDERLDLTSRVLRKFLSADYPELTGPDLKTLQRARATLRGVWRVYRGIETVRDPGASGLNLLALAEGRGSGGGPLTIRDLVVTFNLMSPGGVAQDPSLSDVPLQEMAKAVQFRGPTSSRIRALLTTINGDDGEAAQRARLRLRHLLFEFVTDHLHGSSLDTDGEPDVSFDGQQGPDDGTAEETALDAVGHRFTIGRASGVNNACLIDTLVQLAKGVAPQLTVGLDVEEVRGNLVDAGLAGDGEMLDFYGNDGDAVVTTFTAQFQFRVQVLEIRDGRVILHPIRGAQGPLQYMLHHGLHFCPLTLRGDDPPTQDDFDADSDHGADL